MKNIINSVIVFAVVLLSSQFVQAQGTMTYLSNVDQASVGSLAVGSDSWLAAAFQTGSNASGYTLDSIELGMADASGSPSDFTVMLYNFRSGILMRVGSLGTLDGSLNPTSAGIYTFTTVSNITLWPNFQYYIVITAGTAVADGAYDWSYVGANAYNPSAGWSSPGLVLSSSSGIMGTWTSVAATEFPQFAIDAIPIPEPDVLALSGLGGLLLLWHRRKSKAV